MPVTNLRKLREARRIPLRELSAASGLSGQYINRMELREIPATPRMERQLSNAVSALIIARKKELLSLEADFLAHAGRLLEIAEDDESNEY